MSSDHPFQHLFETFGKLPEAHSEVVNRKQREKLEEWLKVSVNSPGHCILLKAPRAGHGKTHLLTRLQYDLGGTHEFIPLRALSGSRIDATTVLDDTMRRLVRGLPAAGGLTVLDLVARRLFSSSLQPLVNSGEVPCQDREGAINSLRNRPIETFDFHHPGAVTAHWARENFELLGPRLALELSQRDGLSLREVSFWVDAMFRFSSTPIDNPGRVRALAATVFDNSDAEASAYERLIALLGMITTLMRVVLVADEVEGFSSDETAALRFASFIGALRQSSEKVNLVLSVNEDVWKSAFLPRLSDGLADRLSEIVVELEPLDRDGMLAIIESRSPGSGEQILNRMESGSIPTHARGLIKEAGRFLQKDDAGNANIDPAAPTQRPQPATQFATPTQEAPAIPEPQQQQDPFSAPEPILSPESDETAHSFAASPVSHKGIPENPDFSSSGFPVSGNCRVSSHPPEVPAEGRFSAAAAIAAFAAAEDPQFNSPQMASDASSEKQAVPDFSSTPPAAWPLPEVNDSPTQAPYMFSAESVSVFQIPSVPDAPELSPVYAEEAASAFKAPPEIHQSPPSPIFGAAPQPSQEAVSAFQAPVGGELSAAPFQIPPASFAFQSAPPIDAPFASEPPHGNAHEEEQEPSTDRVDELLRQFRERYGKNN